MKRFELYFEKKRKWDPDSGSEKGRRERKFRKEREGTDFQKLPLGFLSHDSHPLYSYHCHHHAQDKTLLWLGFGSPSFPAFPAAHPKAPFSMRTFGLTQSPTLWEALWAALST